jgi:chorismate synthase
MNGNTFGKLFCVTTFGESHGLALGVVIDGVLPGIELTRADIQKELDRRKPVRSLVSTTRKEEDQVEILSGIFEGKTTGSPIALLIRNRDAKSGDYEKIKNIFRPGCADFTYAKKYGLRDYRGGGRASGRETAARVAAGAIAKKILQKKKVDIYAYTVAVAGIKAKEIDLSEIERNALRCPDSKQAVLMLDAVEKAKIEGDSVGGVIEAVIRGCEPGLGEPVFAKLDAIIASAMMSIGSVKGVEIGAGFGVSEMKGSECNDELYYDKQKQKVAFKTNNAGGILGGISTGDEIKLRVAIKPTPSICKEQESLDLNNQEVKIKIEGRHDVCLCPRVVPVVEAMLAMTILDFLLINKTLG